LRDSFAVAALQLQILIAFMDVLFDASREAWHGMTSM